MDNCLLNGILVHTFVLFTIDCFVSKLCFNRNLLFTVYVCSLKHFVSAAASLEERKMKQF